MLTQEQRDTFRRAVASWNACGSADCEIDDVIGEDADVVETRDTIEDFFSARGRRLNRKGERPEVPYEQERTAFGIVYRWENVQARPGARRGDLFVMDFGDTRACYFSGQA